MSDFTITPGTVQAIQGVSVSNTAPTDGQVLTYSSGSSEWEAATPSSLTSGPFIVNATTITGNYTVGSNDYQIFCNQSSAITITLPSPTNGRTLVITDISYDASGHNITISGGEVDGAGFTLGTNAGSITLTANGSDWFIVSGFILTYA